MISKNRALVLTGGGARGAYQAGVLKFIGENIPDAHFETLVGASSGALNIAGLASEGGDLKAAGEKVAKLWCGLEMNQVFRTDFFSLFKIGLFWLYDLFFGGFFGKPKAHSLVDTTPLRELLERTYKPENVKKAIESGKILNLAMSATEVFTGSLVTFIESKKNKVWHRARRRAVNTTISVDHIMASSAIPLLFPSIVVNKRRYVDGCIRSTSPLGPATRLGSERILAVGVRRYYMSEIGNNFEPIPDEEEPKPSAAKLGSLVLNSLFSESLDADVEHLERLNSLVNERQEGSFGMRRIDVMVIRPSEDLGVLANQYSSKIPLLIRFLLRGIGSEQGDSNDMLSYLLFVPEFLTALVELGYNDARAEEARLRKFFET